MLSAEACGSCPLVLGEPEQRLAAGLARPACIPRSAIEFMVELTDQKESSISRCPLFWSRLNALPARLASPVPLHRA